MKEAKILLGFAIIVAFGAMNVQAQDNETYFDFKAELKVDNKYFFNAGLYPGQERNYLSLAFQPEVLYEWQDAKYSIKFTGFVRLDQYDDRRNHFDLREFYWQIVNDRSEISIGMKKVFWGVTESAHLVDVINQTDVVESFDGEEKLGQPMVHFSYLSQIGTFDFFYLPYFRTQTFPGRKGRLRTPFILDGSEFEYESDAEEYRPDVAIRYSNFFGPFDIGISHFYGTSRAPVVADLESFTPVYGVIHQTGLDLQATTGAFLWKWEIINRENSIQDMWATVAGLEYTFGNIGGSGIDIGVLGEYLYDSRDDLALNSLQNDVFFGSRIAFNDIQDTEILFGGIIDLEHSTRLYSIEANRRFGESWNVEAEGRIFNNVSQKEFIYFVREDSFVELSVSRFF